MGRGIERTQVFQEAADGEDFVTRLAARCRDGSWSVVAWALLPTHFHLLVRAGTRPLGQSMRKLLTGYVVNFNRRHKRVGHLFQFLGVTTSSVNRLAVSEELPEIKRYLRALSDLRPP
jgi:putative transposase